MNRRETVKKLARLAAAVRKNAYAPYSLHPVGAALVTPGGRIFKAANCETANFATVCAENAAISAMVSAGEREILDIVVAPPYDVFTPPCGVCRQKIREFATSKTRIHVSDLKGRIVKSYTIDALLPESFGPENMRHLTG